MLKIGAVERLAVKGHPHVVGVDVEADPRGSCCDGCLHQLEHVRGRVSELELPHLIASLIAIEGEFALAVEGSFGGQILQDRIERAHCAPAKTSVSFRALCLRSSWSRSKRFQNR